MEPLATRHIDRCEALPADLPPGEYVVIDVIFFSTTVVELFADGLASLTVVDEKPDTLAFREGHPDALAGGDHDSEYDAAGDYDFHNSPTFVREVDADGRRAAMTSTNGGRTVNCLVERGASDRDDVSVYLGSTTNAAALADHLGRGRDTYLVSAGYQGDIAVEDHIGAIRIGRKLAGVGLTDAEETVFRRELPTAKGDAYRAEAHPIRRADLDDRITDFDAFDVVPKLVDGRFVDVARADRCR
jgi:2-phosphosulfolactate phosphatase